MPSFLINAIDKYSKRKKPNIRSIPSNKIEKLLDVLTSINLENIQYIYHAFKSDIDDPYMECAAIYNPDHPYDVIELNYNANLDKFPIKDMYPNDTQFDTINKEINSLDDLIKLINDYPIITNIKYNIDIHALHKIKEPLEKLNNMVGIEVLKERIIDQLLYFIQGLHKIDGEDSGDFLHTVIYGPPGTGKTEIAMIMGEIFCKLGILEKGKFRKVIRSDLVAGYLGQTALKTKEVIEDCIGGVLFIDEAYSLGSSDKKDSFSKECIDILCEALSANKHNLMVIIAGYETELEECFFYIHPLE